MKTQIEFVNHASVIVSGASVSVLSDPWYEGDAFHKGRNLIFENEDKDTQIVLNKTTHIWLSHEHPDHFSVLFFKKFGSIIKEKKIPILFQKTKDKRVVEFLKKNGFEYIELNYNEHHYLEKTFFVKCIKDGFYDSGLLICNEEEKILNLNDCDVGSENRAKKVFSLTGSVDVLLTQFSYAAWKGGSENKAWRQDAAAQKLKTMRLQISQFNPKITIPFASFVFFSNEKNFYLNDSINSPQSVLSELSDCDTEIVVMQPGDYIGGESENYNTVNAVEFWMNEYSNLRERKLNFYDSIELSEIEKKFISYCDRILNKNSNYLMKLVRYLSPITAFRPIVIEIEDLQVTVEIDYLYKVFRKTSEPGMLRMKSESLYFLLSNSFGFDTLTVNGCFEEVKKGGFVAATKTLAIENLNNMGIHFSLSTLFNFNIIKLFISRLYRVARKLDA